MTPEFPGIVLAKGFLVPQAVSLLIILLLRGKINREFLNDFSLLYQTAICFLMWELLAYLTHLLIVDPSEIFIPLRTSYYIFISLIIASYTYKVRKIENSLFFISIGTLIMCMCFIVGNYIIEPIEGRFVYAGGFPYPSAKYGNQNTITLYIAFVTPIIIVYLVRKRGFFNRSLNAAILVFFGIVVLIALSKGGFIGFFLAIFTMIVQVKGFGRLRFFFLGLAIVIVCLVAVPKLFDLKAAWKHRLEITGASVRQRKDFILTSSRIISDFPLFGIGHKNYAEYSKRYSPRGYGTRDPHNLYLMVASGLGLPAVFILGALLFFLGRSLVIARRYCDYDEYLTLCCFRSQFIVMLWLSNVSGFPIYVDIFWVWLGIFSGFYLKLKKQHVVNLYH
jgi:O-antigen ligase